MSPDTPQTPRPPAPTAPASPPDWDRLLESPASQALLERLITEAQAEIDSLPAPDRPKPSR